MTSTDAIFPENGARTSIVTLSVSILAMTSSAVTASPGDFRTAATVPSVIDSPMEATVTLTTGAGGEEEAAEETERWWRGRCEKGVDVARTSELTLLLDLSRDHYIRDASC